MSWVQNYQVKEPWRLMNRLPLLKGSLLAIQGAWAFGCCHSCMQPRTVQHWWHIAGFSRTKFTGTLAVINLFVIIIFALLVQRNTNQRNNTTNRINPIFISSSPRTCDIYEVAVNFLDAEHRGDRRKKSQQCYFPNCRSLLFHIFTIQIFLPSFVTRYPLLWVYMFTPTISNYYIILYHPSI